MKGAQLDAEFKRLISRLPPSPERESLYKVIKTEADWVAEQLKKAEGARRALQALYRRGDYLENLKERKRAYKKIYEFEGQTVVFFFEFQITEDNNLTSNGSVIWPIMWGPYIGTFTMGYDVGDKKQRYTERRSDWQRHSVSLSGTRGSIATTLWCHIRMSSRADTR